MSARALAADTRAATVLFAAFLVLWGNVVNASLGATTWLPGGSWSFVLSSTVLVLASLAFARWTSLDAASLGLRGDPLRSALIGGTLGGGLALASVAALRLLGPVVTGRAIEYAPLADLTGPDVALHLAFFLPLGDVLAEEIAFRGVLLGAVARRDGAAAAIAWGGAVFALWHISVASVTVDQTTLGPPSLWYLPAIAGALLVVFVGGSLFAWLRLRTGSLASTVAVHWAFNAVVIAGLWATRAPAPSGCCS